MIQQPAPFEVFTLKDEIEEFAADHAETLSFEDYSSLTESAVIMRTLGNLLVAADPTQYMIDRIAEAREELAYYQSDRTRHDRS
ncbi:MAG: hypothetical protein ABI614_16965 [Planctomycetota bacterium]